MEIPSDYEYQGEFYSPIPNKFPSFQELDHYTSFSQFEVLINWVNSFEYPNCLLASKVDDFKDGILNLRLISTLSGIIFCELVNEIILKNQIPDFLPKIVSHDPTYEEKLHNITMALSEIKSMRTINLPANIKELTIFDLLQDDSKITALVKFLNDVANDKFPIISSNKSAPRNPPHLNKNIDQQPKFISDSFSNSSSTQPSPMNNFPGSKPPHKPPLNPPQHKPKPTGHGQPPLPNHNQFKKPAFNQAPVQQEEHGYPPYEQQRAETFSSIDAPHQKMHSPAPQEYRTFEYNIIGSSPQQKMDKMDKKYHPHHHQQHQEDFDSPFFTHGQNYNDTEIEVLRSMNQYDEDNGYHKSYKNHGRSNSKYEQQQSIFSTPTHNRQERTIDYETFSPDHDRQDKGRRTVGEVPSYNFVVPESQRPERSEKRAPSRGNYLHTEQNETRIVPMEVQRKSFSHQKPSRENYDYEGFEGPSQQHRRSKTRSELPHPAPEVLDIRPESHSNVEKRSHSQMNTTRKKEEKEIVITEVSEETKRKLVNWLCQIGLLKENIKGIEEKLPKVCKNGLVFIDLVNRLEGRNEVIKGVNRNSKSKSQINSNYLKVLDYLKGFEKMNPRYLAAGDHLIDGNEEIFWGFLDDIWHLYNKKIAPTDPRYKVPKEKVKARNKPPVSQRENIKPAAAADQSRNDISYNDICTSHTLQNTSHVMTTHGLNSPASAAGVGGGHNRNKNQSFDHGILKNTSKKNSEGLDNSSITYNNGNDSIQFNKEEDLFQILPRNSVTYKEPLGEHNPNPRFENKKMQIRTDSMPTSPKKKTTGYSNYGHSMTEAATPTKQGTTPKQMGSISRNSPSYAKRQEPPVQDAIPMTNEEQNMSIDIEIMVTDWLKQMGYKALLMREKGSLFDDPFRNGTLLCYVLGRVENERMHGMYKEPKTIEECRLNVSKAFQVLKRKHVPIPSFINGREESVLRGDRHVTLTLLYTLMKIHKNRNEGSAGISTIETETPKYEASGYIPPYSELEMEELEKSLINWISNLGLLHGLTYQPASIRELMNQLKNGVLLCDLVSIVVNEKIGAMHRRPNTELQCLTNIRKALEMLRMQKNFGQKYLWKEKEICKGNKYILVGLLEDMHRFYNGLAARRNPNYFGEGPYLPTTNNTQTTRAHIEETTLNDEVKFRNSTYEPNSSNYVMGRLSAGGISEKGYGGILKSPSHTTHYTSNLYDNEPQERNSALNISSDAPISLMSYVKKPPASGYDQSARNTTGRRGVEITDTGRKSVQFEGVGKSGRDSTYRSPKAKSNADRAGSIIGSVLKNGPRSPLGRNTEMDYNAHETSIDRGGSNDLGSILKEWIITIGLADLVRLTDLNAKFIPDMKDGIVLCKIIEKLEMREIPGVILKPHTNASRMVNIRKCLNVLSKRPGVNPHFLHCEDRIVAGDGETIRRILSSIKDAYKFANRCINRSNSRSRSSSRIFDNSTAFDQNQNQKSHYNNNNYTPVQQDMGTIDSYNRFASERKRMLIPTSGRK